MPEAVTQQELESRLWAAANSLRGPVDPSDFKAYIFPLLFYTAAQAGPIAVPCHRYTKALYRTVPYAPR